MDKEKSILAKINIIQDAFNKLALMEKKGEAITILNFAKFFGYLYLLSIKHHKKR